MDQVLRALQPSNRMYKDYIGRQQKYIAECIKEGKPKTDDECVMNKMVDSDRDDFSKKFYAKEASGDKLLVGEECLLDEPWGCGSNCCAIDKSILASETAGVPNPPNFNKPFCQIMPEEEFIGGDITKPAPFNECVVAEINQINLNIMWSILVSIFLVFAVILICVSGHLYEKLKKCMGFNNVKKGGIKAEDKYKNEKDGHNALNEDSESRDREEDEENEDEELNMSDKE